MNPNPGRRSPRYPRNADRSRWYRSSRQPFGRGLSYIHGNVPGGIHHVAIEASDFERSLRFYTEGLGFRNVLTFPEEDRTVAMLDAGDATYVELFAGGSGEKPTGSILPLALRTGDCDKATERARATGGTITQEPTDAVLEGDPPVPVRYSFCEGPDGEQIELLQADVL